MLVYDNEAPQTAVFKYIPANLRIFCHQNNSSIKIKVLNHRIHMLNIIGKSFRRHEKSKLADMQI